MHLVPSRRILDPAALLFQSRPHLTVASSSKRYGNRYEVEPWTESGEC
jgi:hypothetical protein